MHEYLVKRPLDNQTFDRMTFVWMSYLYTVMNCAYFWPRYYPYLNYLLRSRELIGMVVLLYKNEFFMQTMITKR